jgi:CheY-like chemotaxis protein
MILLVEDDPNDVFFLERAMKKANISLPMHNAINGQDALDYLQAAGKYRDREIYRLPSVIFLDLKLPFVHGFEVLRWIKQQSALANIPVFILTSSLEEEDRQESLNLGAQGFFIKPPTTETLHRIFKVLDK